MCVLARAADEIRSQSDTAREFTHSFSFSLLSFLPHLHNICAGEKEKRKRKSLSLDLCAARNVFDLRAPT